MVCATSHTNSVKDPSTKNIQMYFASNVYGCGGVVVSCFIVDDVGGDVE